jgi:hypothetical protein
MRQVLSRPEHARKSRSATSAAALTKVLADKLGPDRVVGLCHGLFDNYSVFRRIFNLKSEEQIKVRFGGVNHFFWILDLKVDGQDGYKLLTEKLSGAGAKEFKAAQGDPLGFVSHKLLTMELYRNYRLMPYVGDRHTCEFFSCYPLPFHKKAKFVHIALDLAKAQGGNELFWEMFNMIIVQPIGHSWSSALKNIPESCTKTGIMNKDGYFAAGCVDRPNWKIRP